MRTLATCNCGQTMGNYISYSPLFLDSSLQICVNMRELHRTLLSGLGREPVTLMVPCCAWEDSPNSPQCRQEVATLDCLGNFGLYRTPCRCEFAGLTCTRDYAKDDRETSDREPSDNGVRFLIWLQSRVMTLQGCWFLNHHELQVAPTTSKHSSSHGHVLSLQLQVSPKPIKQ